MCVGYKYLLVSCGMIFIVFTRLQHSNQYNMFIVENLRIFVNLIGLRDIRSWSGHFCIKRLEHISIEVEDKAHQNVIFLELWFDLDSVTLFRDSWNLVSDHGSWMKFSSLTFKSVSMNSRHYDESYVGLMPRRCYFELPKKIPNLDIRDRQPIEMASENQIGNFSLLDLREITLPDRRTAYLIWKYQWLFSPKRLQVKLIVSSVHKRLKMLRKYFMQANFLAYAISWLSTTSVWNMKLYLPNTHISLHYLPSTKHAKTWKPLVGKTF